jgi:lysozyme
MIQEEKVKLRNLLISHESYSQFNFTDSEGNTKVGIGRNLTDRGISHTEAVTLLDNDIYYFFSKLRHYLEDFHFLDSNRQFALIGMCFNLGIKGLLGLDELVYSINNRDWIKAHKDILDSKWADQAGEKAIQLANIILTGEL